MSETHMTIDGTTEITHMGSVWLSSDTSDGKVRLNWNTPPGDLFTCSSVALTAEQADTLGAAMRYHAGRLQDQTEKETSDAK